MAPLLLFICSYRAPIEQLPCLITASIPNKFCLDRLNYVLPDILLLFLQVVLVRQKKDLCCPLWKLRWDQEEKVWQARKPTFSVKLILNRITDAGETRGRQKSTTRNDRKCVPKKQKLHCFHMLCEHLLWRAQIIFSNVLLPACNFVWVCQHVFEVQANCLSSNVIALIRVQ